MGVTDGAFDCYLLLGLKARGGPLWMRANWAKIEPILEPLVAAARGKAAWTTFQEHAASGRQVRLGALGWGSAAWQHRPGDRREFFSADLYAPALATCSRQDQPPEVHLHLHAAASTLGYDQAAFLAVSRALPAPLLAHARKVAAPALARAVNAKLRARTREPLPFGRAVARPGRPEVPGADQFPYNGMDPEQTAYDASRLPRLAELTGRWEAF